MPRGLRDARAVGPWLHHVPVTAGSAVIFTEALTHGTWPWTAESERRAIFLKYSAPHSAWANDYPTAKDAPGAEASATMNGLLQRPFVASPNGDRKEVVVS